jgi:LysM repeat protein
MAAKARRIVRVGAALLMICAFVLAGLPGGAGAAQSGDPTVYTVRSGDRLVDIAARFGVSASAIVRANGLANADTIYPGQKLIIPTPGSVPAATATPAVVPAATAAARQPVTHTVQLGDTLAGIARKFGVSAAAILQTNSISNPDLIWVGQKLLIPDASADAATSAPTQPASTPGAPLPSTPSAQAPANTPTPAPTPTPQPEPTTPALPMQTIHAVQAGETLSQIARRYGVAVEALVSTNGLGSADMIRVGMKLIIPSKDGAAATGPTARATKFVASISQQRCWLYSGETVIARWICSTGRRGSATKPGEYKIQSKMPKAYGSTWNIWMPFWLGIYWAGASENGIHGLPWDATSGVQIWSGNVGKPITYGCVMLDNVNAKMLYDMAWIGMPVIVRP